MGKSERKPRTASRASTREENRNRLADIFKHIAILLELKKISVALLKGFHPDYTMQLCEDFGITKSEMDK